MFLIEELLSCKPLAQLSLSTIDAYIVDTRAVLDSRNACIHLLLEPAEGYASD